MNDDQERAVLDISSEKYIDFLETEAKKEFLEGTTAAGKTTVGVVKWMFKVAESKRRFHVIAAADIGTAEKNIINAELGIIDIFGDCVEYKGSGDSNIKIPHIKYKTPNGEKIIYICGYGDKKRWEKALGGQVGCLYIDEINIANMEFVREASHRCQYEMATLNPDDPNLPIYKEYINRSRPIEKYVKDYPKELLEQLNESAVEGWIHWYFTFYDNPSLTKEDIQDKINSLAPGTKMYKNKIQGLRGKATGLVFKYKKENIISVAKAKEFKFVSFTVGVDTSYSKQTHDKLTFTLIGITKDRKCVVLKNKTHNNKDRTIPFAPSDVIPMLVEFMEECKTEWGFARTAFIDSADTGTISEAQKFKRETGCIYSFEGAWKKTKNVTRVQLQQSWMQTEDFYIVEDCVDYINELDTYSYKEDGTLEDANDHSIQGGQYAWLPHKKKIGNWEKLKSLIKDADDEAA